MTLADQDKVAPVDTGGIGKLPVSSYQDGFFSGGNCQVECIQSPERGIKL